VNDARPTMAVAFNALIRLIERRAAVWQVGTRAGDNAIVKVGQVA
jgi:NitT/TauT family transport system permease protein